MDKKAIRDLLILMVISLLILAAASAQRGQTELTVVSYRVPWELDQPMRIVQLTDLHGHVFGGDNAALVQMVAEQSPDLILMTGDMLDKNQEDPEVVYALIRALAPIAPVYYGYGNHETAWMDRTGIDLRPGLEEAGAIVLETAYLDLELKGLSLRIGGFSGYYGYPGMYPISAQQREAQLAFFEDFENTERYKLLLSHIPTTWLDWGGIEQENVDLVLCGHYHGGQIRLPLVGGLVAPYVGWLPPYTEGIFFGSRATCVLSTGLGSSPGIPRINNLPQIVAVDLTAK